MWKGECFVFDNRVSVKHNLAVGSYTICSGCRIPISSKDKMDNDYHRYIFTYGMDLSPTSSLLAKVYKAKYSRNWKKVGEMTVDTNGVNGGDTVTVKMSAIDWDTNCLADSGNELRACNIVTNGTAMLANESIKRSLGHRDYGMYGYDVRYNTILGAHDITIGYHLLKISFVPLNDFRYTTIL